MGEDPGERREVGNWENGSNGSRRLLERGKGGTALMP